MNHANHNYGYALIVSGTGRMLVSNCNFYYGKIRLENTNGNLISGCGFGKLSGIEIVGGENSMFVGCMMRSAEDSPISKINNNTARFLNCYDRDGNVIGA